MVKTDSETGGRLADALFGLYSLNAADQMNTEDHTALEERYGIDIPMTVTVKTQTEESTSESLEEALDRIPEEIVEETGSGTEPEETSDTTESDEAEAMVTYYLMQTAVSNSNGQIKWEDLIYSEYCIRELMAPTGYNLDETPIIVMSADFEDVIGMEVENVMGYTLPETGGIGTVPYLISGALLMSGGLFGCGLIKRRRRDEEAPDSRDDG